MRRSEGNTAPGQELVFIVKQDVQAGCRNWEGSTWRQVKPIWAHIREVMCLWGPLHKHLLLWICEIWKELVVSHPIFGGGGDGQYKTPCYSSEVKCMFQILSSHEYCIGTQLTFMKLLSTAQSLDLMSTTSLVMLLGRWIARTDWRELNFPGALLTVEIWL